MYAQVICSELASFALRLLIFVIHDSGIFCVYLFQKL